MLLAGLAFDFDKFLFFHLWLINFRDFQSENSVVKFGFDIVFSNVIADVIAVRNASLIAFFTDIFFILIFFIVIGLAYRAVWITAVCKMSVR